MTASPSKEAERAPDHPTQARKLTVEEGEIIMNLHRAALNMSYHNAAEGKQYYDEAPARAKAAKELAAARIVARAIGFDIGGGYLC